jgi:hypothetical protein
VSSSRCLSGNGKIIEKSASGAEAGDDDAMLARPRKAVFGFLRGITNNNRDPVMPGNSGGPLLLLLGAAAAAI